MKTKDKINKIIDWLSNYAKENNKNGFVVGVSGGIDSALVSTLCVMTGFPTTLIEMPIYKHNNLLSSEHIKKLYDSILYKTYNNISNEYVDLEKIINEYKIVLPAIDNEHYELAKANLISRIRMNILYYYATIEGKLVVGTGNKVEDYGIGFFTKYGDGGVDISPIGDLLKSEVYELAKYLGVCQEILDAKPSDGLWNDNRTDENQIGATYDELEWAMNYVETNDELEKMKTLTSRQIDVLNIYRERHKKNNHKMKMPPVCII